MLSAAPRSVADAGQLRAVDKFLQLEGSTILQEGKMTPHQGLITVTEDGSCWWQHPGWYDDYQFTEGQITDETLVARIVAVVSKGSRRHDDLVVNVVEPSSES